MQQVQKDWACRALQERGEGEGSASQIHVQEGGGTGAEHWEDNELAREATTFGILLVGEAIQKFTTEGIDHMEWDIGSDKFIKASTQDPPLM